MNNYLTSLVPALANHLWQSTACAAAAWLLTLLLRKNSARVRYGLWLAASVKFLLPFSPLVALGGLLPKPSQFVPPAVYTAMQASEQPFADVSSTFVAPAVHLTLAQRITADLPAILVALWLAGAAAVLIVWWLRWRKASVCLNDAVPIDNGRELEILRSLEAGLSGRSHSPLRLKLSSRPTEPSVYGILKPVLVWPRELSERLSDQQIEAIMAHELVHARRFDNATAALHMLVESVFWFHPMVWWMERRMIEERERACDEEVVGSGGNPDAYAEGILTTCRFCVASAAPCITGVTGADLKNRVVDIMTARTLLRMTWSKKLLLVAAAVCMAAAPVLLGQMNTSDDWEKAAGGKMSFEVASVKEDAGPKMQITSGALGMPPGIRPLSNFPLNNSDVMLPNGGLLSATNTPLVVYIGFAYKLSPVEMTSVMSQLPKWANEERFDIQARAPGNVSKDQMRLMMQSLLADRFKLTTHEEAQEKPVYELMLDKPGKLGPQITMRPAGVACSGAAPLTLPNSLPAALAKRMSLPVACGNSPRSLPTEEPGAVSWVVGRDVTAAQLAGLLSVSDMSNRPVIDKTGITGRFDFVLYWQLAGSIDAQPELSAPPFIDALNDQLGLKLAPSTGAVDTFAIDHIEEPAPN